MKSSAIELFGVSVALAAVLCMGCGPKEKVNEADAAPPPERVQEVPDLNLIKVNHPERFRLVTVGQTEDVPQINATGVVSADIERSVPVVSLASGRVVELDAKLGDDVRKGQLLLKVLSNDIATAFQTYKQAQADEVLANKQLERSQMLYSHGAISMSDLEVAQDAEAKAKIGVDTANRQLRTLGADPDRDNSVIDIRAPVSGTIVDQNVVLASGVHTPDNQTPLFTIADLSRVWILCDVYENDLPSVRLGDSADIQLNAYPDRKFHGRISNIGKILDPSTRTAKVRIEMANPGVMRSGMFVTATFFGQHGVAHATVPAGAVLHLHDRDWVFVPAESNQFRRIEVTGGKISGGTQEILGGLNPGQQVVNESLALEAESEQ